jgi:hypothetical protein
MSVHRLHDLSAVVKLALRYVHLCIVLSSLGRSYIFSLSRSYEPGIATGYGPDDQGVGFRVPVGSRIFSSPRRPDQLWGSPNLLSNGYRG